MTNEPTFPKPEGALLPPITPESPPVDDGGKALKTIEPPNADGFAQQTTFLIDQSTPGSDVVTSQPAFLEFGPAITSLNTGFAPGLFVPGLELWQPGLAAVADGELHVRRFSVPRSFTSVAIGHWLQVGASADNTQVQARLYDARGNVILATTALAQWEAANAIYPPSNLAIDVPQICYFNWATPVVLTAGVLYTLAVRHTITAGAVSVGMFVYSAVSDLYTGFDKFGNTNRFNPSLGRFNNVNYAPNGVIPTDVRMPDDGGTVMANGPALGSQGSMFWLA